MCDKDNMIPIFFFLLTNDAEKLFIDCWIICQSFSRNVYSSAFLIFDRDVFLVLWYTNVLYWGIAVSYWMYIVLPALNFPFSSHNCFFTLPSKETYFLIYFDIFLIYFSFCFLQIWVPILKNHKASQSHTIFLRQLLLRYFNSSS